MAKLIIEFEGTLEELDDIAGAFSDAGIGELFNDIFERDSKYLTFDYSKCFPSHGYDPKKHGPDLFIKGSLISR